MTDTNNEIEISPIEDNKPDVTIISPGYSAAIFNINIKNDAKYHAVFVESKGDEFLEKISGEKDRDIFNLLLTAINNRTIERDYFKLYCEFLDESISEEEYEKELTSNEDKYVIKENITPTKKILNIALKLAEHIKSVNSVSDFTALFSFKADKINSLLEK